jgi:hypothetical protein
MKYDTLPMQTVPSSDSPLCKPCHFGKESYRLLRLHLPLFTKPPRTCERVDSKSSSALTLNPRFDLLATTYVGTWSGLASADADRLNVPVHD